MPRKRKQEADSEVKEEPEIDENDPPQNLRRSKRSRTQASSEPDTHIRNYTDVPNLKQKDFILSFYVLSNFLRPFDSENYRGRKEITYQDLLVLLIVNKLLTISYCPYHKSLSTALR